MLQVGHSQHRDCFGCVGSRNGNIPNSVVAGFGTVGREDGSLLSSLLELLCWPHPLLQPTAVIATFLLKTGKMPFPPRKKNPLSFPLLPQRPCRQISKTSAVQIIELKTPLPSRLRKEQCRNNK